jgi:hypothetical protein
MKTLQTLRGRLTTFALINVPLFGFLLLESQVFEFQVRHKIPMLQISKYTAPETGKPAKVDPTLCACIHNKRKAFSRLLA